MSVINEIYGDEKIFGVRESEGIKFGGCKFEVLYEGGWYCGYYGCLCIDCNFYYICGGNFFYWFNFVSVVMVYYFLG